MQSIFARCDEDGAVVEWPVYASHIAARGMRVEQFEPVAPVTPPAHDARTELVLATRPERGEDGRLYAGWRVVPRSLRDVRVTLRDRLAARRWEVETGGIALPDGTAVRTDEKTQTRLIAARVQAEAGSLTELRWKMGDGFVTLTAAQITAIADAVAAHVAACFAAEDAVDAQIAAAETIEELAAIDVGAAFAQALETIRNGA